MSIVPVDKDRLRNLVTKRLLQAPNEVKELLPPVLSKSETELRIFLFDTYLILEFADATEQQRLETLEKLGYPLFPDLVKPKNVEAGAAFRFVKSQNIFIKSCTVKDMFTFSLGEDCTIILQDHTQSKQLERLGRFEYVIDLAYIVSFGDEINSVTIYDFVEDLIAYSLKQWRSSDASRTLRE